MMCAIGIFVRYPSVILTPLGIFISCVQYPFLALYSCTVQPILTTVARFENHNEYQYIVQKINHERSELLKQLIDAESQLLEYKDLRDLHIKREKNHIAVCQIIYKQLQQKDSFFIIDKGSVHGIMPDMIAVCDGVLLGRVTDVFPWFARVLPLIDAQCHVPIICSTSRAQGVYHGDQSLNMGSVDFISHLEPLVLDELVLTSGDGLIYPQGLAVGRIKKFTLNDLGFLYHVDVALLCDISSLSHCSIVSKNTQSVLES